MELLEIQKKQKMTEVMKIIRKELINGKDYHKNYIAPDIPEKVLKKLVTNFDRNLDKESVIAYFDNTIFDTSNGGLLFTKDGFYYKYVIKAAYFAYKDISFVNYAQGNKVEICFNDPKRSVYSLIEASYDMIALKKVIEKMKEITNVYSKSTVDAFFERAIDELSKKQAEIKSETANAPINTPEPPKKAPDEMPETIQKVPDEVPETVEDFQSRANVEATGGLLKAYEGSEKYIFISYAHRDSKQVFPIMKKLQDEGYNIWYDDGIEPGNEWDDEIAEHIMNAELMVAFISPNYIASDNCKDELNFSRDKKIDRILIYIEDTELPLGMQMRLKRQQSISYYSYENKADFYEKLFKAEGFENLKN